MSEIADELREYANGISEINSTKALLPYTLHELFPHIPQSIASRLYLIAEKIEQSKTCKVDLDGACIGCGRDMLFTEDHELPNYCPNCGRKILGWEEEDG